MNRTDIPEELLLHVPALLAEDELAEWLAVCRLVLAERRAATALAVLVQRYAAESDTPPADVAQELYRRRRVEAAGQRHTERDESAARLHDAVVLAQARARLAGLVADALIAAEWELEPPPLDLENTDAKRRDE